MHWEKPKCLQWLENWDASDSTACASSESRCSYCYQNNLILRGDQHYIDPVNYNLTSKSSIDDPRKRSHPLEREGVHMGRVERKKAKGGKEV